jgi:DNA invertase Pin-like site-specific DNA recombinase
MAQIGYARVSSTGQNLETQLDRLAHCDKIFQEKKTGTSIQRPQLTACLEYIREGDILVITKLDRLARSTLHLCQIAQILEQLYMVPWHSTLLPWLSHLLQVLFCLK